MIYSVLKQRSFNRILPSKNWSNYENNNNNGDRIRTRSFSAFEDKNNMKKNRECNNSINRIKNRSDRNLRIMEKKVASAAATTTTTRRRSSWQRKYALLLLFLSGNFHHSNNCFAASFSTSYSNDKIAAFITAGRREVHRTKNGKKIDVVPSFRNNRSTVLNIFSPSSTTPRPTMSTRPRRKINRNRNMRNTTNNGNNNNRRRKRDDDNNNDDDNDKDQKKIPLSDLDVRKEQRLGAILAFGIFCQLALQFESTNSGDDLIMTFMPNWDATVENILDASLATDSTQLFAGAIAEIFSGIVGSIAAVALQSFFTSLMMQRRQEQEEQSSNNASNNINTLTFESSSSTASTTTDNANKLAEVAGISKSLISFSNDLLAAITPYELVKLGSRQRQERFEQEEMESTTERQDYTSSVMKSDETNTNASANNSNNNNKVDVVEIFADVTKWLEYNVLRTEFGESLMIGTGEKELFNLELNPMTSGALWGMFAAVSTQFYADVLYGYFRYGPNSRYKEVRSRTDLDWFSVYALRAASSGVLFGIYEGCQGPVARYIQGTLAGGVDGCIGSDDFDFCLQTYIDTNAPGPSSEAQVRALATNLLMVGQRIQDVAGDTTTADFEALFRAWTVAFLSYLHNHSIF